MPSNIDSPAWLVEEVATGEGQQVAFSHGAGMYRAAAWRLEQAAPWQRQLARQLGGCRGNTA